MTDDKLEKVIKWLKGKLSCLYEEAKCEEPLSPETEGRMLAYREVLSHISSLQEEPKKCMYSKDNYTDKDRKVLCEGCEEECEYAKKEKYFDPISLVHKWDNEFDELLEPYKDSRNYKNLYIKLRWWKHNCKREFLWKWKYKKEWHVSKDRFAFKALPRLLEMLEPNDRAKAYTNRLADALEKEGYNTDAKIVREKIRVMNDETVAMATMDEEPVSDDFEMALAEMIDKAQTSVVEPWVVAAQWKDELIKLAKSEEPVSDDLEQAIDTYLATYFGGEKEKQDWPFLKKMAIHFANWHKQKATITINNKLEAEIDNIREKYRGLESLCEHDVIEICEHFFKFGANWQVERFEKNRLKHCNSITNEQAELEQGFIDQHLDKNKRMPTFLDAIEYGMRLRDKQMTKDAVEGCCEDAAL